jgi:hypothetical protein
LTGQRDFLALTWHSNDWFSAHDAPPWFGAKPAQQSSLRSNQACAAIWAAIDAT